MNFDKIMYYAGIFGCIFVALIPLFVWWGNPGMTYMQVFKNGGIASVVVATVMYLLIEFSYREVNNK